MIGLCKCLSCCRHSREESLHKLAFSYSKPRGMLSPLTRDTNLCSVRCELGAALSAGHSMPQRSTNLISSCLYWNRSGVLLGRARMPTLQWMRRCMSWTFRQMRASNRWRKPSTWLRSLRPQSGTPHAVHARLARSENRHSAWPLAPSGAATVHGVLLVREKVNP